MTRGEVMAKYEVWWQGVGEVMLATFEGESHKEIRNLVSRQIVIRKKKERG